MEPVWDPPTRAGESHWGSLTTAVNLQLFGVRDSKRSSIMFEERGQKRRSTIDMLLLREKATTSLLLYHSIA